MSLTGALHGCQERVRILCLDLEEFCSCGGVVRALRVSMVLLFVFPRAREASCPPAWLVWRRGGRSRLDGEGEKHRISPCSHPDWGDKSTLLVVLKPEEVCLPQPTPAQFYIVQLKQSLPNALAPIGRFSQGGQKRGQLQRRSRNPGLGLRQSGEHLPGSPRKP